MNALALVAATIDGHARRNAIKRSPAMRIGLVGRGIQLSRSPAMHELEGARLGLAYDYILLDLDQMQMPDTALPEILAAAKSLGFSGLNITHPFKQAVMPLLDILSPEAKAIGAVNTIVFGASGPHGHNTDCWGFAESFRDGLRAQPLDTVLQLGAGGGGLAVAFALAQLGVWHLLIHDTNPAMAARLAERLLAATATRVEVVSDAADCLSRVDGLVNATPVGMHKYPGLPIEPAGLSPRTWVADIVYFPPETALLRTARALGCAVLPGTGMAVYQAVKAFELFTGIEPDRHAMIRHFSSE